VLAHLSRRNNHPDLARLAAEEALERAGRRGVRLTLASADGTDWVTVRSAARGSDGAHRQLRLF